MPNILESKIQFQQLAVLIYFPGMPSKLGQFSGTPVDIAMFLVTSPVVINVPTKSLLAVETMHAIVQWLENLNIKRNMTSMFVKKKHRYIIKLIVESQVARE